MPAAFIGRKSELALLGRCAQSKIANLIVIEGRRRIGKSRLADEFGKKKNYYTFTGLAPKTGMTAQIQRDEFARRLGSYFSLPGLQANDWGDLFTILAKQCSKEAAVILFDEISWMGMHDVTFLSKLRNAWDREFKPNPRLTLILCGSISVWIDKNILSSTGFVGRVNHVIHLDELPLDDCMRFWSDQKNISSYEKLKYLSITGGVPLYLENLNPSITSEENIRQLCFTHGGLLVREFDNIFSDLFGRRSELYKKIVNALADRSMETKEISKKIGVEQTGWLSEHLSDLEKSKFICRDFSWKLKTGNDAKASRYRLSDNYLRFYLKYISKNLKKIARNSFEFKSITALPGWSTMLGLQFENIILKNRATLHKLLHVKSDEIIADNPYLQRRTTKQQGCQIDYMIQTKFNNLFVCEIKFSRHIINSSIIKEVEAKIDKLLLPKGFSCRPVLIHVNGVSDEVRESSYFAKIIAFDDMLSG